METIIVCMKKYLNALRMNYNIRKENTMQTNDNGNEVELTNNDEIITENEIISFTAKEI